MDDHNSALLELWTNEYPSPLAARLPLFRSALKPNCLLFIGINPSFSERGAKTFHANTTLDLAKDFQFPPVGPIDLDEHLALEREAYAKHPYFARFREIATILELDWDHLDLLSIRETNQAAVRRAIEDKNGNLIPFAEAQLALVEGHLLNSSPVAIVVANAFASRLLEKRLQPTFDVETGCHRLTLSNRSVPVFLSSMLTGQRALDTFSYQRLIWHLQFALNRGRENPANA
jgi:hypothetical protein